MAIIHLRVPQNTSNRGLIVFLMAAVTVSTRATVFRMFLLRRTPFPAGFSSPAGFYADVSRPAHACLYNWPPREKKINTSPWPAVLQPLPHLGQDLRRCPRALSAQPGGEQRGLARQAR
jgi:hypothetical protein